MDLPRTAPSAQGVDAEGISAFLDALEAAPGVEPHGFLLLRKGSVVAEGWWAPHAPERPHLLYSLSKSLTSTALGFAVAEGLVSLDDTVLSHFPEIDADIVDPRSRRMLVRHIAAMASGHLAETLERARALDPRHLVRGFLLLPPDEEPGSVFAYNQPCTYALAAIVCRASGQTLTEFLRPRLYEPLGIADPGWLRDPFGQELGFSGAHAPTEVIARLGQLYLQRGEWEGRRLLPAEWVDEATSVHVGTPAQDGVDWRQGYGFQFWAARHGYRGDGAYGQFCVVLPEHDAVLAITSESPDMQAALDAAWTHLLPALERAGTAEADAALRTRLAGLRLAGLDGAPEPEDPPAWDGLTARVSAGPLSTVRVARGGPAWLLTLVGSGDGAVEVEVPLGGPDWAVAEPVVGAGPVPAASIGGPLPAGGLPFDVAPLVDGGTLPLATSGGWTPSGALRFDVAALETPHRLEVTVLPEGTATATWRTTPLHPLPFHEMRSPRA